MPVKSLMVAVIVPIALLPPVTLTQAPVKMTQALMNPAAIAAPLLPEMAAVPVTSLPVTPTLAVMAKLLYHSPS